MNRKMQRALGKKAGGTAQVQQLTQLLGQLAPGLAQMEQDLGRVAELGPDIHQAQTEWSETISAIRAEIQEVRRKQSEQEFRFMAALHDVLTGQFPSDLPFQDFLARTQEYTPPPESGT